MQVAINYSPPAASLLDDGSISLDIFKAPAWEDLIDSLVPERKIYVHFPLVIRGQQIINSETKAPVDLDWVARLQEKTGTPYVNVHLAPKPEDYPDIAPDSQTDETIDRLVADAKVALQPLIDRFGAENVIVENVPEGGQNLLAATLPQAVKRVIEASGVNFLLDISHAYIAADYLDMNVQEYLNALPVDRIREMHTTGIELITDKHLQKLEELGIHESFYHNYKGRLVDHLPFTARDWDYLGWCLDQIHEGQWHAPDVVAFEFGGIGGFWEKIADRKTIHDQVNRLYAAVNEAKPLPQA